MAAATSETITGLFLRRVKESGPHAAVHYCEQGAFKTASWDELLAAVRRVATTLRKRGVRAGDRVVQISENRVEWIVCDLAIALLRAVHVPLHAPLSGPQLAFQMGHCETNVVLVSGDEQAEKLAKLAEPLPSGASLISFDAGKSRGTTQLPNMWQTADEPSDGIADEIQAAAAETAPDDLATILYTSGTTGEPKGVMLTHRNLVGNARALVEAYGLHDADLRLSILPWSHIFARTCDLYTWLVSGCQLAIAESRERVMANCAQLQPTLVNGVPYFFDKLYRALSEKGALDTPGSLLALLGGRVRLCCSGGAALPIHVAQLFDGQQVPLMQGYGLTETSPVISVCTPDRNKLGTVGPPLVDVEVRIADDGEILTRGPHVMLGYYQDPQATGEMIRDGWLHTGDLGELDADNFLTITGRKKEIIILSTGKNIAPVQIESLLTEDPFIIQAVVFGSERNYLTALIVPDPDVLKAEIKRRKIRVFSPQAAVRHADVLALYREKIDQRLAELSPSEQIATFHLMDRGFTIESGELTPTLKLRREVIAANCADLIADMYK